MSGEAGHTLRGRTYAVFVGTGVNEAPAQLPGDGPSAIGDYFAARSAPYLRWLERARPELDRLFETLAGEGLPLAELEAAGEAIDGVVIEDLDPPADRGDHFRLYHRAGRPCPVTVRGSGLGIRSLVIRFQVTDRVERSRLDEVAARVAAVLRACEDEPAPPPPPELTPPTAPRRQSWWLKVLSWIRLPV